MNINNFLTSSFSLPGWCLHCQKYLYKSYGLPICISCYKRIVFWDKALCPLCNHFHPYLACENSTTPYLSQVYVICRYNEILHSLVTSLKYKKNLLSKTILGLLLSHYMRNNQQEWHQFEGMIPIPINKQRLRTRGFNQTHVLALAQSYLPILSNILIKTKYHAHQAGLSQEERSRNIIRSFTIKKSLPPKKYLLLDDVFTTGNTLNEAARILLEAGAKEVCAITLAHT